MRKTLFIIEDFVYRITKMALCRDVMHTSNPSHDYAFSWTIEHFEELSPMKVRGPAFSPISGYAEKFCFELAYLKKEAARPNVYYLYFKIIDLDTSERDRHLSVSGKIAIKNMEEQVSDLVTFPFINIQPITILHAFDEYSFGKRNQGENGNFPLTLKNFGKFGLADGKIILEGTLKFSGYSIKSSIYSMLDRNCEEVTQNLKTMFDSGIGSDVTFTVGSQILRAHKAILVARSEVFAKMFQQDMIENKTNNVIIEDVDYGTFNRFLLYLYTGVLELAVDNRSAAIKSLYSVAQKYQVKGLCKICVPHLARKLTVESVCADLVLADLHGDEEFKGMVEIFLRENIFSVVGTLAWTDIVATNPALAKEVLDFVKPAINNP